MIPQVVTLVACSKDRRDRHACRATHFPPLNLLHLVYADPRFATRTVNCRQESVLNPSLLLTALITKR